MENEEEKKIDVDWNIILSSLIALIIVWIYLLIYLPKRKEELRLKQQLVRQQIDKHLELKKLIDRRVEKTKTWVRYCGSVF